jgi:hypothetical protein
MINTPLQTIANQSFTIQLFGINYDINIHDCHPIMAVTLFINNTLILSGMRAVPNFPLIPYAYLEKGNFIFTTGTGNDGQYILNAEYPYWRRFNIDQFLIYASPEELQIIAEGGILTASDFDADSST